MNEYDELRKTAERYRVLYPVGTRIELIHMGQDKNPIPDGTRGTVTAIDDIGTIHCHFDNGRLLGIIPGEHEFRKLNHDELLDERSSHLMKTYVAKLNRDVVETVDWEALQTSYDQGNFAAQTDILKALHETFIEVYGADTVDSDLGFVKVPGVIFAADGNLYPVLLDLDTAASGEHWGTTVFTPSGIFSDADENEEAKAVFERLVPYKYWYLPMPNLEDDIHVDFRHCPEEVRTMINEVYGMRNEVKLE